MARRREGRPGKDRGRVVARTGALGLRSRLAGAAGRSRTSTVSRKRANSSGLSSYLDLGDGGWLTLPVEADLYRTLQVDPLAEHAVIEAAYRRLARKYHPDLNRDDPGAEE